ncbi:MAG: uncharacterized protein KVP18_001497 [Porospora cf. gigantea A]|uniref:uncharacterized protein n=1 Tax=Porospora cf. gigantea A TaxID=2853593 RepID=UPI00355992B6|nr:MAG: hypothetical protein KVP18_001497 [Porospora cf. gigantea A]
MENTRGTYPTCFCFGGRSPDLGASDEDASCRTPAPSSSRPSLCQLLDCVCRFVTPHLMAVDSRELKFASWLLIYLKRLLGEQLLSQTRMPSGSAFVDALYALFLALVPVTVGCIDGLLHLDSLLRLAAR